MSQLARPRRRRPEGDIRDFPLERAPPAEQVDAVAPHLASFFEQKRRMNATAGRGVRSLSDALTAAYGGARPEEVRDVQGSLRRLDDTLQSGEEPGLVGLMQQLTLSGPVFAGIGGWLEGKRKDVGRLSEDLRSDEARVQTLGESLELEKRTGFAARFRRESGNVLARAFKALRSRAGSIESELASAEGVRDNTERLLEESRRQEAEVSEEFGRRSGRRAELAERAVRTLFTEIAEGYVRLGAELAKPEVMGDLNDLVIEKIVRPRLEEAAREQRIPKVECEEFVVLIRKALAQGGTLEGEEHDSLTKLRQKYYKLDDVTTAAGCYIIGVNPSRHYSNIFGILLREQARRDIERARDALAALPIGQELGGRIGEIAQDAVTRSGLDLQKVPIACFSELNTDRWRILRGVPGIAAVAQPGVFDRVEGVCIQRLFSEHLFPGGHESWPGTYAANQMYGLKNPRAIPLLLEHIETYGSGHTSVAVFHTLESLLGECDQREVQQVTAALPPKRRKLLEIVKDPNSFLNRYTSDSSGRYTACNLMKDAASVIAKEQLARILAEDGSLTDDRIMEFYTGFNADEQDVIRVFLARRDEVERVIIESRMNVWSDSSDKLLSALVNPRNGDPAEFPLRIMTEGLGFSEGNAEDKKRLDILKAVFAVASESGFDREAILDGLLLLNSKENGKQILDCLLDPAVCRGSKEDVRRLRRILQLAAAIDGFGEYDSRITPEGIRPPAGEISRLESGVRGLSEQISEHDKAMRELTRDAALAERDGRREEAGRLRQQMEERKRARKSARNTLEREQATLGELTGLHGIEDQLFNMAAEAACRKLNLPAEYRNRIKARWESLVADGVFNIVPALAGSYDARGKPEVKKLLSEITRHIVDGDFEKWRYSHDATLAQLSGLSEQQKKTWTDRTEETVEATLSQEEVSRRTSELESAQQLVRTVRGNIEAAGIEVSQARLTALRAEIEETTLKLKSADTPPEEKKRIGAENRTRNQQADLIAAVLEVEGAQPESFRHEDILSAANQIDVRAKQLGVQAPPLKQQVEGVFAETMRIRNRDELNALAGYVSHHLTNPDYETWRREHGLNLTDEARLLALKEQIERETDKDKKMKLTAEARLMELVIRVMRATPETYDRDRMRKLVTDAIESPTILELGETGAEIKRDLTEMQKIFSAGAIERATAYDTDNPIELFNAGVEPQETCQSWRRGSHNHCLLSYVADGNKRLLNVRNSEGVLVARSMIKLTKQRDEGDYERKTERPTMLVERPYGPSLSDVVVRAFAGTLFRKADEMGGVSVTLGKDFSADMMRVITEEAEKHGYRPREGTFQVHIPQSANAYEYSDSLGGEIRYFDTYHSYTGITFEKAPTRG